MNPINDQQLDEIEQRANAATKGPWCTDSWEIYQGVEYEPGLSTWIGETCRDMTSAEQDRADAAFVAAARTDVPALVAEVRRLRAHVAAFTTLAERWDQLADQGDAAIGHFEGPAAATLNAEVGERGRTYRKAAADARDVVRTGHIPHDLMTGAELDAARPAVRSAVETGA